MITCTFSFQSVLSLLVFLLHNSSAWPVVRNRTATDNGFNGIHPISIGSLERRSGDFYLRIMPLGASITYGYLSSDGNG